MINQEAQTKGEDGRNEKEKTNLQALFKTLEYQVKQAIALIKVEQN